jgi:hypothetical protein
VLVMLEIAMTQLETQNRITPPPKPNSQHQAIQAAEKLIRRHTDNQDTEDLIDIFHAEVKSGVPIKEAMNGILKWDEATHNKPKVERFTAGFAITPVELMTDQSFMEGFNHTGRLMMVYLQVSNGGTGDIFLSNKTLMDRTFISDEQSVIRAKNRLKKDGRIFETGRKVGRGINVIRLKTPQTQPKRPLTNRLTDPSQIGSHKRTEEEKKKKTTPKQTKPTRMIQNDVVVSSVDIPIQTDKPDTNNKPIHPAITNKDQTIINRLLAKVDKDQSSELIDELKARLDGEGEPIRNPVGFIVSLIKSVKGGTWAISAARRRKEDQEAKRLTQERQKEEQKRLKAEEEHQQTEQTKLDNAKSQITTEELLNHKERFISKIKATSDFNFKRLKAQNFSGVGFDMLFNGYLREELLGS